jgi:hypothetical protein
MTKSPHLSLSLEEVCRSATRGRPRLYMNDLRRPGRPSRFSCLEFLSKKFEEDVANQRGDQSNLKIGGGKNIMDRPSNASLLRHARALKFAH